MLAVPTGFRRSVESHNIKREAFLDWLEASTVFSGEEFSRTDVVDYLLDHDWYAKQDLAREFVGEMWDELRTRLAWLGDNSIVHIDDEFASLRLDAQGWREAPVHSFCLVVSFGPRFVDWHGQFSTIYNTQGQLFELITKAAMESRFHDWKFIHTGWGSGNSLKLKDIVDRIVARTGEREGISDYVSDASNDAGVDLVWYLPFADGRGGTPIYLAQCASGSNWIHKIGEPDIKVWEKIIDFAATPNVAFSIPFALAEVDLRRHSNRSGTRLLLDRYRLLEQNTMEEQWVPPELRDRLVEWLEPLVQWILER